jgi:hypothetical protein
VLAGLSSLENVAIAAIVPNLVTRARLRGALAVNFGWIAPPVRSAA